MCVCVCQAAPNLRFGADVSPCPIAKSSDFGAAIAAQGRVKDLIGPWSGCQP